MIDVTVPQKESGHIYDFGFILIESATNKLLIAITNISFGTKQWCFV